MAGLWNFDLEGQTTNPLFLGGAALLSGEGMGGALRGMQAGNQFSQQRRKQAEEAAQKQRWNEYAQGGMGGLPPEMAALVRAAGPKGMDVASQFMMRQPELELQRQRLKIEQQKAATLANSSGLTDQIREFQFAQRNGFGGSFEDWKRRAAAGANKFGLTPIPIERLDGSIGYIVPSTSGETRELAIPGGGRALPPTTTVQTPTEVITQDRFGREIRRESKNIQGAEFDKVVGREAGEVASSAPKAAAALAAADAKSDRVLDVIQEAKSRIGALTAGFAGAALSRLPGTAARDVSALLDTLKANAGFAELQAMKENSPTGSALGQVAVQELAMLQASITSLEQAQTPEQLLRALATYEKFIRESKVRRRSAYDATYRQTRPASPGARPPPNAEPQPQAAPSGAGWSIRRVN